MKIYYKILVIIFIPLLSFSQNISNDSLFNKARNFAYNGNRTEARIILKELLINQNSNSEARVLLSRTYSWDNMFDSARVELKTVLKL